MHILIIMACLVIPILFTAFMFVVSSQLGKISKSMKRYEDLLQHIAKYAPYSQSIEYQLRNKVTPAIRGLPDDEGLDDL